MPHPNDMTIPQDNDPRYQAFLTAVGQWEGVWGLYHNGWLLHRSSDGPLCCPLFATREDAIGFGASIATNHVPSAITLIELTEALLPDWESQKIAAGISPSPAQGPIIVSPAQLTVDLLSALKVAMRARFAPKD
ncbi:DUF2750 domain-containing protein [Thalassospira sp. MA62]|nr:DUF2750 domain-containing protein [Thalassospira sp. MA62]